VLGRVDAETVHAHGQQGLQVIDDLALHIAALGGQVGQAAEAAVLHVAAAGRRVVVDVVDVAVGVEVAGAEVGVGQRRGIPGRAVGGGAAAVGHLVDDDVGVDPHTGGVAGVDHGLQLGWRAHAAGQVDVVDRLVDAPPAVGVLGRARRRDLHAAEALGAQPLGAFGGDVVPTPLEHLHRRGVRVQRECWGGGAGRQGQRQGKGEPAARVRQLEHESLRWV